MKYLLFIILLPQIAWAQQAKIEGYIRNQQSEPLAGITVQMVSEEDSLIAQIPSNKQGIFYFPKPKSPIFSLRIQALGYEPYIQSYHIDTLRTPLYITLKTSVKQLEEVHITAAKPVLTAKVDRLEYHVERSQLSALNAWEILKRTPSVNAQNNNLKIQGSQAVVVTINDKLVHMSGEDLKNLLENTPGVDIKTIEVIHNPPANYEAAGGAVINIKMKQSTLLGYRGILSAKYEQSQYAKSVAALSNYYKSEKLNFVGSYNFANGTYMRNSTDVVYYEEDQTTWTSAMFRKDKSTNQNSYNLLADYAIDSSLTLSLGLNGYYRPNSRGIYRVPTIITNSSQEIESNYLTLNDHHRSAEHMALYLKLAKNKKDNMQFSWTNYFTKNQNTHFQKVHTFLNFKDEDPQERLFISQNSNQTSLFSSQVDYSYQQDKWKLESGAKYAYIDGSYGLDFQDNELAELQPRPDKSSIFHYREQNAAAYATVNYKIQKFDLKAGLRAEYTDLSGRVSEPYSTHKSQYLSLFPTFYALYQINSADQIGFSYGKRISRPSYSWLNPAKSYYNMFSYFHGDPKLQASIIHNLNLTYHKDSWITQIYYRYRHLPSMEISYQDFETKSLVFQYTNIKKSESAGVDLSKSFSISKAWTWNANAFLEYALDNFQGPDQLFYSNHVYSYYGQISSTYTLNPSSEWTLEAGYYHYSPTIQGSFSISSFASAYILMNRKFAHKKLEASIYINDLFRQEGNTVSTNYANQNSYFKDYSDSQKFSITLRYNFGNQSLKKKATISNTEEQNRL